MASFTPFKDIAISFTRNKITDDILVKKDAAAVKQAVINILLTNKGERLFDSSYGSDVPSYLFNPLDYGTAAQIENAIQAALRYEPRIRIIDFGVEPDFDSNGFEVLLSFNIIGRNDSIPYEIEFFLESTR